ncbi:MAG: hypothetical protein IKQ50_06495 [Paludibacteraceae bacterium]|nr:hypothetical protein [Paludibacteraceae bacterium]
MKRHLLMLWVAILATAMSLEARTVVIDEGFENGIQESEWTQEFVSGNMPWAVEDAGDDLEYPSTVFQGSKRAYLRNTTGETMGYKTRLISKVMDLRPTKVYMPELVFWYANPRWGGDRDTLRVLYRTGSRAAWKQLAEFSTAAANWQRVKLELPEVSSTYQIAFEGSDNLGRGIVLDSIKLQSAPECTIPYDLMVTNKGAGKVNFVWTASYDAEYYEVIISRDTIDPYMVEDLELTQPQKIAYHGNVYDVTNCDLSLEAGEFYLAYVRSVCEDENSAWSSEASKDGPFGFQVRVAKQIPFTERFNYASGTRRDADWSYGSNTGKTNPFVNSTTTGRARANYSPDTTAAVIFSGGAFDELTTVIPADRYVFMATPALSDTTNENFKVNQCQVHFWSTVYTSTGRQYGRSLIVGVMDDPDDITTFTPVDTVSVWGNMTFQENIVDLASYTGSGVYVAFVSDFDRDNLFFMDNLTIEYRRAVNKVTNVSVNPRDTYATISWEGNAPSYNVLITNAEVNPNNPSAEAIVDEATVTSNSYLCEALEADHSWNRPYYVYVQAAGQEWSYRYPFVTIASQRAIPYSYDFEASTTTKYQITSTGTKQYATGIGIFGNSGQYPAVTVSSAKSYAGSGHLYMSMMGGKDGWITLPMVEDLDSVQIKFYLSGYTTYDQAHATVGVMSNPMDINTFIPVADFQLNTEGYTRCYANFENYNGPEGVIAIVWADVMNMSKFTNNYIDDILVEKLSDCVPPTNINLDILPDSITVGWEASALSDEWEFFLTRSPLTEKQRIHKTLPEIAALGGVVVADTLHWDNPNTAPEFGFGDLIPHTSYYLYVRATCDMEWWSELAFSTPCRDEAFPYKETFEGYNSGSTEAGCWQLADYMGVDYPVIYQAGSTTLSNKTLELYSSGTIHRSVAIMPVIEGNLSDMLLSFDVRTKSGTSSSSGVIIIGTMEDIHNQSSFVPFDTIRVSGSSFQKVRCILSDYNLGRGNLAFTSGLGTLLMNSDVLIDNVELSDPSCIEAYDFRQTTFAPNDLDVVWNGVSDNDKWMVKVLNKNISIASLKNNTYNHSADVITDTLVIGKSFHATGLMSQTDYYVYIRTLCGDSVWAMTQAHTTCDMLDPNKPNKESFESYSDNEFPDCWTWGSRTGTASSPYVTTISSNKVLHIHQSTSTSPTWAASPQLKCDSIVNMLVSFNIGAYSGEYGVYGVMTDPTDLSTFVALDSVRGTGSSNMVARSIDLSNYASIIPPTAKYFAWRGKYGDDDWVYIDDISFISLACPMTKPGVSDLTTNSARISSGLRTADEWIMLVTDRKVSEDDLAREDYVVPDEWIVYRDTIDKLSREIYNLSGQTKYYVATATLCDSVTMSQWSTMSFMTPCEARTPEQMGTITFSDEDGFETGSGDGKEHPCWTLGSKAQNAPTDNIPYIDNSTSLMHNKNNYLRMYDYVGTSGTYVGAYAIMPELEVDSISKYQVNFWGRGYSSVNSQLIVGVVTDPSDLNTFVAVDTVNLSKTAWDPFSVGFETYESDYMGDVGRNIMFLSDFGVSNYAFLSEISVELIPHCRPISSFTVDSVGESSAVISWKGYQDSYRLLLADRALTDAEKLKYHYLLDTVVDHSDDIRITGLESSTNYYVYAQGFCDEGDSTAISIPYAFIHTTCPTEGGVGLPFDEDFEGAENGSREVGCMLFRHTSGNTYPKVETASNGSKAVDMYTSGATSGSWLVLPVIGSNLSDLKLSFDVCTWQGGSSVYTMFIGTMADPEDPTTFVPFASVNSTSSFVKHEFLLSEYDLPYERLAFTSGMNGLASSGDMWIDNIHLELAASCGTPRLKSLSTSFYSAELTLTPASRADTLWEVAVIPDSVHSTIGNITQYLAGAQTIITNSTRITLSNLESATSYYIYARTICGEKDMSTWTRTPLKITTQFYYQDSWSFGFEKTEQWEQSVGSASDNYYIHPALVTGRDDEGAESQSFLYYPHSRENTDTELYARTDAGALLMYAYTDYHGGYIIFPAVEEAKARSFEFKARNGYVSANKLPLYSTDAVLEIGTIEKDKDFDTYQPMVTLRMDRLAMNTSGTSKNNQLFSNYSLNLDSTTIATRQLVLHLPKQPMDTTFLFIDDVQLTDTKTYSLVALDKVVADGSSALVEWQNIGGPWNLYIKNTDGGTIAQYLNLSGVTSQLVEGLDPQTDYVAELVAVNAGPKKYDVTSDHLSFRTLCQTLEPDAQTHDFVWNFDNQYEWEENDVLAGNGSDSLYFKPGCFNTGIAYSPAVNGYQWLVQRKNYEYSGPLQGYSASRHYEVGRNDSHALRVHTLSDAQLSYLILPALNCGFDSMMIEFYGRCFVNYDQTYGTVSSRGRIVDATYLGAGYSHSVVVGTLTDPKDFSTLQILDTLTYSHTDLTSTDNVNSDPDGLGYWELMQLPLDAAQGRYIVLFQPGEGLFFLDDLSVKPVGNTLFKPTNTKTSDVTESSATLSWSVKQPQYQSVIVLLDGMGNEIFRDTVSGTSYQLTDLQGAKIYQWYVYQIDGNDNSPATKPLAFTTECVVISPAYTTGFEQHEGWQKIDGQSTYNRMLCWTYSDAIQNEWVSATYDPFNQSDTRDYNYSFTGGTAVAMRASYSARGNSYQPYIAMPEMDVTAYDTLQVNFWIRPAYVSAEDGTVISSYTGSTYSKSIIVGTMTDPTDATTFVPLDTVTYDGTLSMADVATSANNYLYQRMSVELVGATGPYVAFMTSFAQKGGTQKTGDYLWIDEISFEHKQECKDPTGLEALQIGTYHATLHWNGIDSAASYLLQVSTDPYFAEGSFVFNEEVTSDTYTVRGLEPLTTYVWRVQSVCGGRWGESAFSQKATFKTSRSPYFLEEFNKAVSTNEWTFSKAHAENVVDNTGTLASAVDTWGFNRVTNNYGIQSPHYAANGYSGDYHWMVTPNFYLPEDDSVHFSMDLALTACNTAHTATNNAVTENDMKDDYYFMIIISDDGGLTWKSENILAKWQNTNPEGQQLREIPATGMQVRYSLAPYAGKNVRIGLYREAKTASNTGITVHVDNVRLAYFDKEINYASACEYEDIQVGEIYLSGDDTKPGIHAYPTCFYATDAEAQAGKRDSVYQLEIEVFATQQTLFTDTICEGDSYTDVNFHGKEQTGVYRRKLQTAVHGCDSIITLNLQVKERRYADEEEVAICQGETYMWNDKPYNRAGIFRDTLLSSIGCDSILTLVISYNSASADTVYDQSRIALDELPFTYDNPAHPYAVGQKPIFYPVGTPKGVYVDEVRVEGEPCAAVLVHTLTIYDPSEDIDEIGDGQTARKVLIDNQLYIVINDEWYNAAGLKVADPR